MPFACGCNRSVRQAFLTTPLKCFGDKGLSLRRQRQVHPRRDRSRGEGDRALVPGSTKQLLARRFCSDAPFHCLGAPKLWITTRVLIGSASTTLHSRPAPSPGSAPYRSIGGTIKYQPSRVRAAAWRLSVLIEASNITEFSNERHGLRADHGFGLRPVGDQRASSFFLSVHSPSTHLGGVTFPL